MYFPMSGICGEINWIENELNWEACQTWSPAIISLKDENVVYRTNQIANRQLGSKYGDLLWSKENLNLWI